MTKFQESTVSTTTTKTAYPKTIRTPLGERTLYYSCSYEDFRALKEFHRYLLRAWVDHKKWVRWARKTVHQHGPAPTHFDGLSQPTYRFGPEGARLPGNFYLNVLTEYRKARQPHYSPETCPVLNLPTGWRELAHQLQEFYAK